MTAAPETKPSPTKTARSTAKDGMFSTDHLKSDLRGRSVRGGAATLSVRGCTFVLHTASTVVLARILTPADYGLIAMVATVTGFLHMFATLGLSTASIQKKDINHDQVSTLFWVNTAVGCVAAALVIALAPVAAWFYGDPRLTLVTMALGTGFVFAGLTVQHQAMLTRQMRFLASGVVGVLAVATGSVAGIAAALSGAGYWSLVIMNLVTAMATLIGKWIAFPWIPGRPKRGVGLRAMLGFGGHITGFNVVNYFARNADNILIGKVCGSVQLGFYAKAYALLMMPITQIRHPLMSVAMPAMSRLQADPKRYRNYYLKLVQTIAFLSMPLIAYMAVYSEELVTLVLGPQWVEAARIFRPLAIAALFQPVGGTTGAVMTSLGLGRRYFRLGSVLSVVCVISFVAGLPWGAYGVAVSYAIGCYAAMLPGAYYTFRGTPIRVKEYLGATALPFSATLVMVLGALVVNHFTSQLGQIPMLLIGTMASPLFYLAAFPALPGGLHVLKDFRASMELLFKRSPANPQAQPGEA